MKSILGGSTCSDNHKDQGVTNAFWESQWSLKILVGVSSSAELFKAKIEIVIGWGLNQKAYRKG